MLTRRRVKLDCVWSCSQIVLYPLLAMTAMLLGTAVRADYLTDYFEYDLGDASAEGAASLAGPTTSNTSGWASDGWTGAGDNSDSAIFNLNRIDPISGITVPNQITFGPAAAPHAVPGYVDNTDGGLLIGSSMAPAGVGATVSRSLANPATETVWMSVLMASTNWNGATDASSGFVLVNSDTNDRFGGRANGFDLAQYQVFENGSEALAVKPDRTNLLPAGSFVQVLVVAKLETDFSGSNDRMTLWFFHEPSDQDEANMNLADLSAQNVAALDGAIEIATSIADPPVNNNKYETTVEADLWGTSIESLGLNIRSARDPLSFTQTRFFMFDNLRISFGDGLTDDEHVARVLGATEVPPGIAGDFNEDGTVDAADYTVWRDQLDSATALPNDDGLGTPIGNGHYDLWSANFGMPGASGSGALATAPIPEPSSLLLAFVAVIVARRSLLEHDGSARS